MKTKTHRNEINAESPNFFCENCRAIYYCSDECRIASTSGRNGDHDRNACMRLAEEVSLFEQLVKKTEGGAEDELLGVQESACNELKRLGVHKHREYRRECSCFDFVPFGELVYNELRRVSTYEEYIASELQYFRKLLRDVNDGDTDWVQKHARVDHLPFSIAQNILKFNLDIIMESSVLRVYIAGCEKEFDTFERVAKKIYALTSRDDEDGDSTTRRMEVYFVGPELSKRLHNTVVSFYDGKLQCILLKGLLGTSAELEGGAPPDIVYCPNAGVAIYTFEWHAAVRWCILNAKGRKKGCLMLFSDYTFEAAWKGYELLLQWIVEQGAEGKTILPVCENAFKHPTLRKHERVTTKQVREYSNGFIFGFGT